MDSATDYEHYSTEPSHLVYTDTIVVGVNCPTLHATDLNSSMLAFVYKISRPSRARCGWSLHLGKNVKPDVDLREYTKDVDISPLVLRHRMRRKQYPAAGLSHCDFVTLNVKTFLTSESVIDVWLAPPREADVALPSSRGIDDLSNSPVVHDGHPPAARYDGLVQLVLGRSKMTIAQPPRVQLARQARTMEIQ